MGIVCTSSPSDAEVLNMYRLTFVVLALSLTYVSGLECYACDSREDSDCEEVSGSTATCITVLGQDSCGKVYDDSYVARSCAVADLWTEAAKTCGDKAEGVCICDSDKCNGAHSFSAASGFIMALISAVMLILY